MNLLRVFAVVADEGSVTAAANRLYLTQPAVSAALRRLTAVVGAPLFVRGGRALALTTRGRRLRDGLAPHLQPIIDAALTPEAFDPSTSERTLRLGLTDSAELWLLPRLLRVLETEAPRMRVVSIPVDFRTVAAALSGGGGGGAGTRGGAALDAAVTVADDLPATVRREPLFVDGFTCLYDPRHVRMRALTEASYFAHAHVIVSHNGDLRGIVEDQLEKARFVRGSVASFAHLGAIVEGTSLLATVPHRVADQIRAVRPKLAKAKLPFELQASAMELLWPASGDDDAAGRYARSTLARLARQPRDRGSP